MLTMVINVKWTACITLKHFRYTSQNTHIHTETGAAPAHGDYTHTPSAIGSNFMFSSLPKETSTYWLQGLGIKPPTFWLVDDHSSPWKWNPMSTDLSLTSAGPWRLQLFDWPSCQRVLLPSGSPRPSRDSPRSPAPACELQSDASQTRPPGPGGNKRISKQGHDIKLSWKWREVAREDVQKYILHISFATSFHWTWLTKCCSHVVHSLNP